MNKHNRERRALVLGGAATVVSAILPSRTRGAQWQAKQFHNQPAQGHQHQFLTDLWGQVKTETRGRLEVTVVKKYVALQRAYTDNLNGQLEPKLVERGMIFNTADAATFRRKLAGAFYQRWRSRLGTTAWNLLEDQVGKLG